MWFPSPVFSSPRHAPHFHSCSPPKGRPAAHNTNLTPSPWPTPLHGPHGCPRPRRSRWGPQPPPCPWSGQAAPVLKLSCSLSLAAPQWKRGTLSTPSSGAEVWVQTNLSSLRARTLSRGPWGPPGACSLSAPTESPRGVPGAGPGPWQAASEPRLSLQDRPLRAALTPTPQRWAGAVGGADADSLVSRSGARRFAGDPKEEPRALITAPMDLLTRSGSAKDQSREGGAPRRGAEARRPRGLCGKGCLRVGTASHRAPWAPSAPLGTDQRQGSETTYTRFPVSVPPGAPPQPSGGS